MDFNLNDEQELFVAGIRELMASENWEAYFTNCFTVRTDGLNSYSPGRHTAPVTTKRFS